MSPLPAVETATPQGATAKTKVNGHATPEAKAEHSRIVDTYGYVDEQGELLYEVLRLEPKSFRQRRPDGNGGWTWSLDDVRRVLYKLPLVIETKTVYVVEGERDAGTPRADFEPHEVGSFGTKLAHTGKGGCNSMILNEIIWCGEGDSNPQEIALTSTSS